MLTIIVLSSAVVGLLAWLVVRARYSTNDLGSVSARWIAKHCVDA